MVLQKKTKGLASTAFFKMFQSTPISGRRK
nr:MAG TPA: hypothetical protein [Caudoviricetes sp.]